MKRTCMDEFFTIRSITCMKEIDWVKFLFNVLEVVYIAAWNTVCLSSLLEFKKINISF